LIHRLRNAGIAAGLIAIIAMGAPGQHPTLTKLQPRSFDRLKREFNAAADQVRIILLLSPT
jgi:hypothetical protein